MAVRRCVDADPADCQKRLFVARRAVGCAKRWRLWTRLAGRGGLVKDAYLEVYLNIAEFDEGVFGVEAASRHYFGVEPESLTEYRPRDLPQYCPPRKRGRPVARHLYSRTRVPIMDGAATIRAMGVCVFRGLKTSGVQGIEGHRRSLDLLMARLYPFPLSPFCRKVRLSLGEKKIEVRIGRGALLGARPRFLRRNPAGKVPVLEIDGDMMSESAAICEYLEEKYPHRAA